jgi:hypothetical protein
MKPDDMAGVIVNGEKWFPPEEKPETPEIETVSEIPTNS